MDSRRFLTTLAIFSAGVVFFLMWNKREQPKPQETPAPTVTTAPVAASTRPASGPATGTRPATQAAAPAAGTTWTAVGREEASPAGPNIAFIGNLDPASKFPMELRLNSQDAGIETAQLSGYYETVADKKLAARYGADHQGYLAAWKKDTSCSGHYVVMRTARLDGRPVQSYGTRLTSVALADGGSIANASSFDWQLAGAPAAKGDNQAARWQMTVLRDGRPVLEAVKTYTVRKDDYTVVMTVELTNRAEQAVTVSLDQMGPVGVRREDIRSDDVRVLHGRMEDDRVQAVTDLPKEVNDLKTGEKHYLGKSDEKNGVVWIGMVNKFFGSMVYLVPKDAKQAKASGAAFTYGANFYVARLEEGKNPRMLTGLEIPNIKVAPGKTETVTLEIFTGPKSLDVFTGEGDVYFRQRYKDLSYSGTIDLGSCPLSFCVWNWLTLALMWLLRKLSAVGNYGVAIILLVIIVRILLHPLSRKSQVSMMKMQKLQPLMAQLKEKYKDDKDTLQKEMMKLYREQGAMPFLGCLPMFLQMPILISLWGSINASVELRHAAFLPVWITDLAAPDALFGLGITIPILNISTFNLLPLLLGGAMYWQMKVNPQSMGGASAATPDQQRQQKMMQVMMVLLMPLMFYDFPSGLSLYFMVSTFFGAAEQALIRKHIRDREAAQGAIETTISAPGKGFRTARPKKPKGPSWFKHS